MSTTQRPIRAFLSYPFKDDLHQEGIVNAIREIIVSCGIEPYEIKQAGVTGDLSTAIDEGIRYSDMFIAILIRDPESGEKHTRPWLVSEIGLAKACNKRLVIFQDKRVGHFNLGIAVNQILVPFDHEQPRSDESAMRECLLQAVSDVEAGARIVRDKYLKEVTYCVVDPTSSCKIIPIRELTIGAEDGWMSWDIFMHGCESLYEQFTKRQSLPIDLWVGVNATGTNIAAYLDGRLDLGKRLRIPFGLIKSGPEDPDTHKRKYHCVLPAMNIFDHIPKTTRPAVFVVDSQLKSGNSQKDIRNIIKKHFRRDLRFHHVVLIANGIHSPERGKRVPMMDLFTKPLNKSEISKELYPEFLAYISLANIKPPYGLP